MGAREPAKKKYKRHKNILLSSGNCETLFFEVTEEGRTLTQC